MTEQHQNTSDTKLNPDDASTSFVIQIFLAQGKLNLGPLSKGMSKLSQWNYYNSTEDLKK